MSLPVLPGSPAYALTSSTCGLLTLYQVGGASSSAPSSRTRLAQACIAHSGSSSVETAVVGGVSVGCPLLVASCGDGRLALIQLPVAAHLSSGAAPAFGAASYCAALGGGGGGGAPSACSPSALAFDEANQALLSGDAFGRIQLRSLREVGAEPEVYYSGSLEGGAGPHIHALDFWPENPQNMLVSK